MLLCWWRLLWEFMLVHGGQSGNEGCYNSKEVSVKIKKMGNVNDN